MSADTWMGKPIETMSREQLADALQAAVRLLESVPRGGLVRPDVELRETAEGTTVGRTFNWAFIPAGHLWSEVDRRETQSRLDAVAGRHGLQGATVRFGPDRLDVEVPRKLQAEQILALRDWLEAEREALDLSQVP
jgi:hypothetical protein